jgi:hypothetical protein
MRKPSFSPLAISMGKTIEILVKETQDIDRGNWAAEAEAVDALREARLTAKILRDGMEMMVQCLDSYISGACGPLVEAESR